MDTCKQVKDTGHSKRGFFGLFTGSSKTRKQLVDNSQVFVVSRVEKKNEYGEPVDNDDEFADPEE